MSEYYLEEPKTRVKKGTQVVTVDLMEILGTLSRDDDRLNALEAWKDTTQDILKALQVGREEELETLKEKLSQNADSFSETEERLHRLIVEMMEYVTGSTSRIEAKVDEHELKLNDQQALIQYFQDFRLREEESRKEVARQNQALTLSLKRKEQRDEARHRENVRRFKTWSPIALALISTGSVKALNTLTSPYSWVLPLILVTVSLVYYAGYTWASGSAEAEAAADTLELPEKESKHDNT